MIMKDFSILLLRSFLVRFNAFKNIFLTGKEKEKSVCMNESFSRRFPLPSYSFLLYECIGKEMERWEVGRKLGNPKGNCGGGEKE